MYMYICTYVYIYIYIYIPAERGGRVERVNSINLNCCE